MNWQLFNMKIKFLSWNELNHISSKGINYHNCSDYWHSVSFISGIVSLIFFFEQLLSIIRQNIHSWNFIKIVFMVLFPWYRLQSTLFHRFPSRLSLVFRCINLFPFPMASWRFAACLRKFLIVKISGRIFFSVVSFYWKIDFL